MPVSNQYNQPTNQLGRLPGGVRTVVCKSLHRGRSVASADSSSDVGAVACAKGVGEMGRPAEEASSNALSARQDNWASEDCSCY